MKTWTRSDGMELRIALAANLRFCFWVQKVLDAMGVVIFLFAKSGLKIVFLLVHGPQSVHIH
jgi:hypothetical protein